MNSIQHDIEAFEQMKPRLEAEQMGQWVLLHNQKLINTFDSFDAAADVAMQRFGRGPFLIRQVGAPLVTLPVSVLYHRPNGKI